MCELTRGLIANAVYDFANILFAGPCNARCPFCIGRQIDRRLSINNLDEFPPRNLDRFIELIRRHNIRQVVFTGTTTDPQLYRHEAKLLDHLRRTLPVDTHYALHTNGQLALRKLDMLRRYDRACISLPTFNQATYTKMMGLRHPPDLAEIVRQAQLPIKVSCVINEYNAAEIPGFLARCQAIGVRRVVLRNLYRDRREWNVTSGLTPHGEYRGNPVYDYNGLEITDWNFDRTESVSINLFSTGFISKSYLLADAQV